MPTLTATSKDANIMQSFHAFVKVQIGTGLSLAVFEGAGSSLDVPITALPVHWVEASLQVLSPQTALMNTSTGSHGVIQEYLANLNVFEKKDAVTNGTVSIYALTAIVDQIKELLQPPTGIPIYDYDTVGTPQVGALIPQTVPSAREVPTPTGMGLNQVNITSSLHQISESTD